MQQLLNGSNVIPAGKTDDRETPHLKGLHAPRELHRMGRCDSHHPGMVRDGRRDTLLPDIRHATKGLRRELARAAGKMAGMDRGTDKDRDKVVAVLAGSMDRDIRQMTEMKPNQVRMPCDKPPVFGLVISAYAIMQSRDTAITSEQVEY